MKLLRALRRRVGIFAPEVIVRPRLPWQLRLPGLVLFAVLLSGLGLGLFEAGRSMSGGEAAPDVEARTEAFTEKLAQMEAQLSELRTQLTARERQIQVEQETQVGLAQQVKSLQSDNLRLKEDLALFETLLAGRGAAEPLSLLQFKVERAAAGEYRYRFLLAQGAGAKRFQGHYELLIRGRRGGAGNVAVKWPPAGGQSPEAAYRLNFQHYQRVEGTVRPPADLQVTEIEVRIYESGSNETKLSQVASPT